MNNNTASSPASRSMASVVLQQRKPPVLPVAQSRQPIRVLQTGHAPAQLSLFLRPRTAAR